MFDIAPAKMEKIITFPWERSITYKKLWQGSFFEKMILSGDDEEEQRVQKLREKAIQRPRGKRGYLSIWRAKLLTDSYQNTEGESAILRKAKGFKNICENIPIPYEEGQLLLGNFSSMIPGTEIEPEFMGTWLVTWKNP